MPPQKASAGKIRQALSGKKIITFNYANLPRVCEPHVYGISNGRRQLLCWQLDGESQRGGIPEWRRFDMADIGNFKVTGETFPGQRLVPFPHSIWDRVFSTV